MSAFRPGDKWEYAGYSWVAVEPHEISAAYWVTHNSAWIVSDWGDDDWRVYSNKPDRPCGLKGTHDNLGSLGPYGHKTKPPLTKLVAAIEAKWLSSSNEWGEISP